MRQERVLSPSTLSQGKSHVHAKAQWESSRLSTSQEERSHRGTNLLALWSYASSFQKVKVLVTLSCPALCDPMDCIPPGSSVHGILQARILEWVAIPYLRGSSRLRASHPSLLCCRQILYHVSHPDEATQGSPPELWENKCLLFKPSSMHRLIDSHLQTKDELHYSCCWLNIQLIRALQFRNGNTLGEILSYCV